MAGSETSCLTRPPESKTGFTLGLCASQYHRMLLGNLALLLHVDLPQKQGAGTCYIVAQQYSDKFPEIVFVELANGTNTPHFQYRFEVLRDIEAGWNYYTAELRESKICPLHKLQIVSVASEKFLRITSEAEPCDDLGNLPEV